METERSPSQKRVGLWITTRRPVLRGGRLLALLLGALGAATATQAGTPC